MCGQGKKFWVSAIPKYSDHYERRREAFDQLLGHLLVEHGHSFENGFFADVFVFRQNGVAPAADLVKVSVSLTRKEAHVSRVAFALSESGKPIIDAIKYCDSTGESFELLEEDRVTEIERLSGFGLLYIAYLIQI